MTLKHWQLKFEQHNTHLRKGVWRDYASTVQMFVDYFGEDTDPKHIFQSDILAWRAQRAKKIKASSIRHDVIIGKAFFNFIAMHEGVEQWFNPFRGVRAPYVKKGSPEDIEQNKTPGTETGG